jgi:hypothetical protein
MKLLFRMVIIAVAAFMIWAFSDLYLIDVQILKRGDARWFNTLFAISESVLAPLLAVAAILLAAANKSLGYAALSAGLAIFFFVLPFASFAVGILIYGF